MEHKEAEVVTMTETPNKPAFVSYKKVHKRTKDCAHIITFGERFKMKPAELSKVLGQGSAAVSGWLKKGDAPLWTHLAIEGLTRRHKVEANLASLFILELPNENAATAKSVIEALGGTLTKIERN